MERKVEDKREVGKSISWNCIIITCSDLKWRDHTEKEVNQLARAGLLPSHDLLIVVGDPQPSISSATKDSSSCGVGSGGATLNALLNVTEKLSALAGDTTINSDILSKSLILMVHFGRTSYHYPGGNAFLPVDSSSSWVPPSICCPTPPVLLQNTIWMASLLASKSSHGVWITSVDFFIPFSPSVSVPSTHLLDGALICSLKLKNLHNKSDDYGFLNVSPDGGLQEIIYKRMPLDDECQMDARVICGLAFMSPCVADKMLSLYTLPPLDRCTYYGTDSASEPVQVSLYFDLILPLCSNTNREKYLSGELGAKYANRAKYSTLMLQERTRARYHIWNQLRSHSAFEHQLDIDSSSYLNPSISFASTLESVMSHSSQSVHRLAFEHPKNVVNYNSRLDCALDTDPNCKVVVFNNCLLGSSLGLEVKGDCVVSDIHLPNVECVTLCLGSRMVWQRWPLEKEDFVVTCHGFDDSLAVDWRSDGFSLFNHSWSEFAERMDITPADLWDPEDEKQTLARAKLFPSRLPLAEQIAILGVVSSSETFSKDFSNREAVRRWKNTFRKSLEDAQRLCATGRLFRAREDTFLARVERLIRATSQRTMGPMLLPSFKYATSISSEKALVLLDCLHEVLQHYSPTSSRLLANVADLLGCLGGAKGGLRSGPAANKQWMPALLSLKKNDYKGGIKQLEGICKKFIRSGRSDDIIRASRHYERASQILIAKQVETVQNQVFPLTFKGQKLEPLKKDVWVEASCPARLDLAGGWTDTPPVCYELGGAVLNIAIKVNGKKPIGARARFTDNEKLVCVLRDWSGVELELVWQELSDLKDYDNPVSSGALVKACLAYTKFVDLEDEANTLRDQLVARYGGGMELTVWSELRQGSGLGGSTLVAGTVLAVLFVLMGFEPPSTRKLIHATLDIEQMLTTGGGWQDSVGGLIGGLKLGFSKPEIPLVVDVFSLPVDDEFLYFLNQSLVLIYTGKVRLARNLLQTVLRNWYAREAKVTTCFRQLQTLALEAAKAALSKDGPALGKAIDKYWQLKKIVASGCEPTKVSDLMATIQPSMLGQSLAGAGGGGYGYGLTSDPKQLKKLILSSRLEDMDQDFAEVDLEGLRISIGGVVVMEAGCEDAPILTLQTLSDLQKCFKERLLL